MSGDHHSFSNRSSSSMSSTSSSSASWTSEPSLDDETYLMHKPQHSLSCSNIPGVRKKSQDRESEDFDFDRRDQKHRQSLENTAELLPGSHHGLRMPKLSRAHSKSEEGLQQSKQKMVTQQDLTPWIMDHFTRLQVWDKTLPLVTIMTTL